MEKIESCNIPVNVAAKVLRKDAQTVRFLLQNGLVDWGMAYKRQGSRQFSYIIPAKKFYEETGFQYHGQKVEG